MKPKSFSAAEKTPSEVVVSNCRILPDGITHMLKAHFEPVGVRFAPKPVDGTLVLDESAAQTLSALYARFHRDTPASVQNLVVVAVAKPDPIEVETVKEVEAKPDPKK